MPEHEVARVGGVGGDFPPSLGRLPAVLVSVGACRAHAVRAGPATAARGADALAASLPVDGGGVAQRARGPGVPGPVARGIRSLRRRSGGAALAAAVGVL